MKNRGHQIDIAAKLIYDLTKELVQTPTTYIKILHSFACRTIETFAEPYCSVEAYKDFYSRTGDDIRKYNWYTTTDGAKSRVKLSNGSSFVVHREYRWEHKDTYKDMKSQLIELCNKDALSISKIKELISKQRICWITLEEDNVLTKLKYKSHRSDPDKAYKEAGIEIYKKRKKK